MKIQTYLIPYDSGRRGERMGAGPEHWVQNGLENFLRARGHTVQTQVIETQGAFQTEITTSFELYRQLAGQIQKDCGDGEFPLVLSGNCGAALGGVSGLSGLTSRELGIVWLDAHGDFNTPDTTQSGFLDGMGLGTIAGLGWKTLANTLPGFRPVPTSQILHAGGRDFDRAEAQLFEEHRVARVDARQVRETGMEANLKPVLDGLAGRVRDLYLHFDVDVLDPVDTPANPFPAPDGLYPNEVVTLIAMLRDHFHIRGMGVASFDPRYDPQGKTRQAVFQIISAVAP